MARRGHAPANPVQHHSGSEGEDLYPRWPAMEQAPSPATMIPGGDAAAVTDRGLTDALGIGTEDLGSAQVVASSRDSGSGTGGTVSGEERLSETTRRSPVPARGRSSATQPSEGNVMGTAAAIGGVALIMGPLPAAVLAAGVAYAITDDAGSTARAVGKVGLQVANKALDVGGKVASRAVEEGRKRILDGLESQTAANQISGSVREKLKDALGEKRVRPKRAPATEEMKEEAREMQERYPDRVPVICERAPYSDLPEIPTKKFIVPMTMLCGEFKYIVHKHIVQATHGIAAEQTVYLFVNGLSPKNGTPMAELYEQFREDDGFLYVSYGAENTLGGRM